MKTATATEMVELIRELAECSLNEKLYPMKTRAKSLLEKVQKEISHEKPK